MRIDLEFESSSPFLPQFSIPLNRTFFDKYVELGIVVLEKEKHILETTTPYPETDSRDWITNRLYDYNFLDYSDEYPVLREFKSFIHSSYIEYCNTINAPVETVYANCWVNVIRNNERTITAHTHSDAHIDAPLKYSYVSGNICISADQTKTHYSNPFLPKQSYGIQNVPGELILFPSWVLHWVDKNTSESPRISIAFDIVTEEVYKMPSKRKNNFRKL